MPKIDDIKVGDEVSGVYHVQEVEMRHFANKPGRYLHMRISDETGTIYAVCFDPDLIPFTIKQGAKVGFKNAQAKDFKGDKRLYFYPGSVFKIGDIEQDQETLT